MRTEAKGRAIPDHSLEVADTGLEAVLLQGAVFLLPFGVEEVLSDALEEGLALWQVQLLKRFLSGFWLAGNNLSQACVHLQGSPKEATKVQEHLEDPAKVLFLLHQVLRLGISATGRIVKNFPEKEINI